MDRKQDLIDRLISNLDELVVPAVLVIITISMLRLYAF